MQNEAAGYCKSKAIVSLDIELGGIISKAHCAACNGFERRVRGS